MARLSRKIGVDEKGQRTVRSTDVYLPKEGMQVSYCTKCGVIYREKRWIMDPVELVRLKEDPTVGTIVCPACQKMRDNVPGGFLTLSGEYLRNHENEILELIKNTEEKSRNKNPLGRIMEISQEEDVLTILTTLDKLAEKLGKEIYKAHSGELNYQWSHGENSVRVYWKRE
ncbi:MAG TPA: BCAM0308 family protein [Geobacteraceae bacterium]|nr:BCAM0308 family protein [Geobacteraceae bacterium]